ERVSERKDEEKGAATLLYRENEDSVLQLLRSRGTFFRHAPGQPRYNENQNLISYVITTCYITEAKIRNSWCTSVVYTDKATMKIGGHPREPQGRGGMTDTPNIDETLPDLSRTVPACTRASDTKKKCWEFIRCPSGRYSIS
ncbi:hypothetical protein BaRGS_00032844, partial [Batillaria attramentaria]